MECVSIGYHLWVNKYYQLLNQSTESKHYQLRDPPQTRKKEGVPHMPESQIYYMSELVERNLDKILQQTEFSLINYVGLTPEEANRTINLAMSHIIGMNSISQQEQPRTIRISTDSDPDYALAEIPLC